MDAHRSDPTLRPPLPKQPSFSDDQSDSSSSTRSSSHSRSSDKDESWIKLRSSRSPAGPRTFQRQSPVLHQDTPIANAVSNAFDEAPSTNQLDPKLVQQLTEQVTTQVLKTLQAINVPTSINTSLTQQSPVLSETRSNAGSLGKSNNYKPPCVNDEPSSPDRASDDGNYPPSTYSTGSRRESKDTRQPSAVDADLGLRRSRTSTDAGKDDRPSANSDAAEDHKSGGARKDSLDPAGGPLANANRTRPLRTSIVEETSFPEPTTLEKIWKPLFQPDGEPTQRLSQFLRGLADHIIHDYEPKDSLVVGPRKMLRFFNETAVAEEHYPWRTIFGGSLSFASIGNIYRKLLCQYHLIQPSASVSSSTNNEVPNIPGLTPHGFAKFMTTLIRAHPDTECARLCRALVLMPLSNADNKAERFPKELPRSLLPSRASVTAEQRLISSLDHEPVLIPLGRRASATMPPPPPGMPPANMRRASTYDAPRTSDRAGGVADDCEDEDGDSPYPPAMVAERQRKPYHGRTDGSGAKYDSNPAPAAPRERGYDQDRSRGRYEDDYNVDPRYKGENFDARRPRSVPKPPGLSRTQSTNVPPEEGSYGRRQYSPPTAPDVRRASRAEGMDPTSSSNQDSRRSRYHPSASSDVRDGSRREEREYQDTRQSRSTGYGYGNGYSSSPCRESGWDRERGERDKTRA